MNCARQTTNSSALAEDGAKVGRRSQGARRSSVAFMEALCDHSYPGTREGFILVLQLPPSDRDLARDRAQQRRAAPGGAGSISCAGGALTSSPRTSACRVADDGARLACAARRWPSSPAWARPGTRGWSRAATCAPPSEVLEALARALQHDAGRTRSPAAARPRRRGTGVQPRLPESASPSLRRLIENLGPATAYVLGRRWDVLAWNHAACALISDFDAIPSRARATTCG